MIDILITKTVKAKWNNRNKKHYESKGYEFTKVGEEFDCKVEDIFKNSSIKIKAHCDNKFCNKEIETSYQHYNQNISNNEDGKYYCKNCSRILGRKHDARGVLITLSKQNQRICNVTNCNNKHEANGYCNRHYRQVKKYGYILERTYRDRNLIEIYDNYAEIILENIKCEEVGKALIDIENIDKCKPYSWHLCKNGYVTANINDKQVYLHRFIMNIDKREIQVDHINRCRFDNRKENLRLCVSADNGKNKRILDSNTSGYAGIRYDKRRKSWYASIKSNGKEYYLGSSKNIEDVVELREKAELKYFGEFSPHFKELKEKYKDTYKNIIENKTEEKLI